MSPLEINEFRELPNWMPMHELPPGRVSAGIEDLAASPAAELLLRQMLIFGWTRFLFFFETAFQPPSHISSLTAGNLFL